MSTLLHDLRHGLRTLLAAPLTTAAAVLVIALGVGANAAVFAVAYGVLIRPLPYPDPSRLVILSTQAADGADFGVPLGDVEAWQRRLRTVEALAGYGVDELPMRGPAGSEPRLVRTAYVTDAFFEVLGADPARGRLDPFGGAAEVAVVSEGLRVAVERSVGVDLLGRAVTLGGRARTVAAVLPPAFGFPSDRIEAWVPAVPAGAGEPDARKVRLVARLAPGVSLQQAGEDAMRVLRDLRGLGIGKPGGGRATVTPLVDAVVGQMRPVLGASAAAALLVLLVTCGNVAMLLLGRAAVRRRDVAVRIALGAGPWRLVRGSLVESFLLAALGSLAGLWLAGLAVRVFARAAAGVVPRSHEVAVDAPVVAAGAAMVFAVTLLCGAAPALHVARKDFGAAFRGGAAGEPRTRRVLAALVVGQIAASIVLLTGASLLARTVSRLLAEDAGFDPSRALAVELRLDDGPRSERDARRAAFAQEALARVRALPGVEAAGFGSGLPPAGLPFQIYVRRMTATRDEGMSLSAVWATPGFLDALGARLVSGRLPAGTDEVAEGRPVVLLSESAARLAEPGVDLAGRELRMTLPPIVRFAEPPLVLGVIRDLKYTGLDRPAAAAVYLPWDARPAGASYLVVRTAGDPALLAPAVRRILRELDPALPIPPIRTLEEEMTRSIADRRLRVLPAMGFAAVALGVALTGIFALLSRAVAERRRELAIRMALGATAPSLVGLVLRRAALLTAAGLAVGLAGTAAVAGGLRGLLFGVGPHDPATIAAALLFVGSASLLAAWLPARRAARVEPVELLRAE